MFDGMLGGLRDDVKEKIQKSVERLTKLHIAAEKTSVYAEMLERDGSTKYKDLSPAEVDELVEKEDPRLGGLTETKMLYKTPHGYFRLALRRITKEEFEQQEEDADKDSHTVHAGTLGVDDRPKKRYSGPDKRRDNFTS